MGLLGFGVIGKKVSRLAQVFGANVIAYDPFVSLSDADSLGVTFVDYRNTSFITICFLML